MAKIVNYFDTSVFRKRLLALFKQPVFIFMTLWGHSVIVLGTGALFYFEQGVNPKVESLLDTFTWAIGTVTTVGYGDFTPVTTEGKVVSIFMMILGSLFLWSYTALFAGALVAPELRLLEAGVKDLEKDVHAFEKDVQLEERSIEHLILQIETLTQELKRRTGD
jgi:voltage-gated potassium channel Kch